MSDQGVYLIKLNGSKDEVAVVLENKEVFDWIEKGHDAGLDAIIEEKSPVGSYLQGLHDCMPGTGSSPDNDRALTLSTIYESLWDEDIGLRMDDFTKGRPILGTYEGVLY